MHIHHNLPPHSLVLCSSNSSSSSKRNVRKHNKKNKKNPSHANQSRFQVSLSSDIILHMVRHFLSPLEFARCQLLNRHWHHCISDNPTWKKMFLKWFSERDSNYIISVAAHPNWKKEFGWQYQYLRMFDDSQDRNGVLHREWRTWDKPVLQLAPSGKSVCVSCKYLIHENTLMRSFRIRSLWSPRRVHAACHFLKYHPDSVWVFDTCAEVANTHKREIMKWVLEGMNENDVPPIFGVSTGTRKLLPYKNKWRCEWFLSTYQLKK